MTPPHDTTTDEIPASGPARPGGLRTPSERTRPSIEGSAAPSVRRNGHANGSATALAPRPPARGRTTERTAEAGGRPASALDWEALEPDRFYARYGKRALNVVLLALTLPVALVLALPIALVNWAIFGDFRRILFSQPRVGSRGSVFHIYKFRTMREADAADFDSWKENGDRLRVTRFGRLLRNTHLDELPQLINVLRGEMDFIGPRPEMVEIDRWACRQVPGFRERNALLPGITGFAQITLGYAGMDPTAYRRKLAADQHYRRHLTLRLDLQILFRTAVWMLRGRGWRREGESAPASDSRPL